ncbi:hypothetical protein [Specibacter cremeus]|uniref:hypothetical protein n=1 Tax=Specibacter cremeus TaxID=1629051 RepID=UPI000F774E2D|nr:hypothetical protein [Specibacter cremeus]
MGAIGLAVLPAAAGDPAWLPALWPLLILLVIVIGTINNRMTRRRRQPGPPQPPIGRPGYGQPVRRQPVRPQQIQQQPGPPAVIAPNAPFRGTLLNGIPIPGSAPRRTGHAESASMQRMLIEQDLKGRLDALDTARRSGRITAEQYASQREAIFRTL